MKWDNTSYKFPSRIVASYLIWSIPDLLYRISEIILWNGSFQLLLSMLVFSLVNIILLRVVVLILSFVKIMIIIRMYVRCFSFFCTTARTVFTSSIWFLDAFSWICASWFSSRFLWFRIFLIVSSCDFFSISNSLIWFYSSWLRLFRHWFSSCFSSIFPSRSSLECSLLLLFFNFFYLCNQCFVKIL